jgi:hypothetical protein
MTTLSPTSLSPAGRRTCRVLFVLVLALVAWTATRDFPPVPEEPTGDEWYYLRYLQVVSARGLSEMHGLFERWNADTFDHIFPSPLRVGFIATSVAWGRVVGVTYRSLQTLSLVSLLLACVLNWIFARRHLGELRALLVAALVGFSPLLLGLSRRAFADGYAFLCSTAVIWLFLDALKDPGSAWKRLLFVVALAWTVLVKEHLVLLAFPLVAFLFFERWFRGVPHDLLRYAIDFAAAGILVAGVLLLAAGGFTPLAATVRAVLESPASNEYAIKYGSGPWFSSVLDFLLLSPWPTLLAIGGFWIAIARARSGSYERESVYFAFLCAGTLLALDLFTKNVRYAAVLELPIRALAVFLVWDGARAAEARRRTLLACAVVALLCWLDVRGFRLFWVDVPGFDPVTTILARVRQVIP